MTRLKSRGLTLGLLVALLTLATWRTYRVAPLAGFDPSWTAALHMAAHRRLHWGPDLTFSYGPLGFLDSVRVFYGGTALLAFAYAVAVQAGLVATVLVRVRRRWPLPLAAAGAYLAGVVAVAMAPTDVVVAIVAFWAMATTEVVALRRLGDDKVQRVGGGRGWVPVVGGALAGLTVLTKFNSGVLLVGLVAAVAWWVAPGRWRSVALAAGGFGLATLGGWLATGNRAGDLPAFVRGSAQVASGYSAALGLASAHPVRVAAMAVAAAVIVVALAARATAGWPRGARLAAAAAVAVVLAGGYKHGFVREEPVHLETYFGFALLLALALAPSARRVTGVAAVAVLLTLFLLVDETPWLRPLDPTTRLRAAGYQLTTMPFPGRRRAVAAAARRRLQGHYRLDPATLALLADHTVHVDPWETAVVWAYRLDRQWRPLPMFQATTADTSALDAANARALADPGRAPDRILRPRPAAVDGRDPDWESPAAVLAMVCHYRQLRATDRWQVLGRTAADRCGPARPLATVAARPGQGVAVPAAGPGDMVIARVEGLDGTVADRLRTLLYRSPTYTATLDRTSRYRLVPGTAADGLLLALPPAAGFDPAFGLTGRRTELAVDAPVTIRFEAVAIT
jgi:hypothetical protein